MQRNSDSGIEYIEPMRTHERHHAVGGVRLPGSVIWSHSCDEVSEGGPRLDVLPSSSDDVEGGASSALAIDGRLLTSSRIISNTI